VLDVVGVVAVVVDAPEFVVVTDWACMVGGAGVLAATTERPTPAYFFEIV
jgi:hypothetical protein